MKIRISENKKTIKEADEQPECEQGTLLNPKTGKCEATKGWTDILQKSKAAGEEAAGVPASAAKQTSPTSGANTPKQKKKANKRIAYLQDLLFRHLKVPRSQRGSSKRFGSGYIIGADGIYGEATQSWIDKLRSIDSKAPAREKNFASSVETLITYLKNVKTKPKAKTLDKKPSLEGNRKAFIYGDSQACAARSLLAKELSSLGYIVSSKCKSGANTAAAAAQIPEDRDHALVFLFTGGNPGSKPKNAVQQYRMFLQQNPNVKFFVVGPPPASKIEDISRASRVFPYLKGQPEDIFINPEKATSPKVRKRVQNIAKRREKTNMEFQQALSALTEARLIESIAYLDPRALLGVGAKEFPASKDGIHMTRTTASILSSKIKDVLSGTEIGNFISDKISNLGTNKSKEKVKKPKIREVDVISRRHGRIPRGKLPEIIKAIRDAGEKHGVDPEILMGVVQMESGFNPNARSYTGAKGLFQFITSTGNSYGLETEEDFYDIKKNADAGARFFKKNIEAVEKITGETLSPDTEYLAYVAHNQGREGMRQIVRASRNPRKNPSKGVMKNMRLQGSLVQRAMDSEPENPAKGFLSYFSRKWKRVKPKGTAHAVYADQPETEKSEAEKPIASEGSDLPDVLLPIIKDTSALAAVFIPKETNNPPVDRLKSKKPPTLVTKIKRGRSSNELDPIMAAAVTRLQQDAVAAGFRLRDFQPAGGISGFRSIEAQKSNWDRNLARYAKNGEFGETASKTIKHEPGSKRPWVTYWKKSGRVSSRHKTQQAALRKITAQFIAVPAKINKKTGEPVKGSSHMSGRAIDFHLKYGARSQMRNKRGKLVDARPRMKALPEYKWLQQNAWKYGLTQYGDEPWHFEMDEINHAYFKNNMAASLENQQGNKEKALAYANKAKESTGIAESTLNETEWWKKRRNLDNKNYRILIGKGTKGKHTKKGGPFVEEPPKNLGDSAPPG